MMEKYKSRKRPTSKRLIAKVAQDYVAEIKSNFPGVDADVTEGIDGFDVWIQIEFPEELGELEDAIRTVGPKVTERYAAFKR
jgi:hypothetical protein